MSEADGAAERAASNAPRAVVAGHGDLAAGLVSAVAQITGRGDALVPLTNRGLGGEQLEATLREALSASGARLVFTDLPGGSWTMAVRRLMRADPTVVLVTGVNLAMLLDWLCQPGDASAAEGARAASERGRGAIVVAGGAGAH